MKNALFLLCLFMSLMFTNQIFSQLTQEHLIGEWQLVKISGGITGRGVVIKKKKVIAFTADCRYTRFENDSLTNSGFYHLTKLKVGKGRGRINIIEIGSASLGKNKIIIDANRLVLRRLGADAFTRVYRRLPKQNVNDKNKKL